MSVKHSNFVNLDSSSEEHQNEKTLSLPPRKKSLSPPQAPSKSISSKSTHIPHHHLQVKLPPLASSPNNPYVSTMDNWPPGPSKLSSPPRVIRLPPKFPHPPLGFEQLTPTQPLFVNINNNAPQLHNNAHPLENIHHPPPNLRNQDFPNPLVWIFIKKDKNEAKTDKVEHDNEMSVKKPKPKAWPSSMDQPGPT
ncbi:hypothetical protein Tco_0127486 [Tanacetum coccineum]